MNGRDNFQLSIFNFPLIIIAIAIIMSACNNNKVSYDASGSFEAEERIISAEATGVIRQLNIVEGQHIKTGDTLGYIDISNLELELEKVQATINAADLRTTEVTPQITTLNAQMKVQESNIATLNQKINILSKEIIRFTNLVKGDAATQKQLDDLIAQQEVYNKELLTAYSQKQLISAQITAAKEDVALRNRATKSDVGINEKQLEIIKKKMNDGLIVSFHAGTILTQYAYDGEYTATGKPLYKIADLSNIILRAYITGDQLPQIKLNQKVKVLTDDGKGEYKETEGTIIWINDKAEFTPKTIQTKDERANLVYAIKVSVKNEGYLKIGMYGEIKF